MLPHWSVANYDVGKAADPYQSYRVHSFHRNGCFKAEQRMKFTLPALRLQIVQVVPGWHVMTQ